MNTYKQTAGKEKDSCVSFTVENGALCALLLPQLSDPAWNEKTLGEIFSEPYNELPYGNFSNGLLWARRVGKAEISKENCASGESSLHCSGNSSAHVKEHHLATDHRYFLGAGVYCTRHVKGSAGVSVYMGSKSIYNAVSSVNHDFQPVGLCFDAVEPFTWYAGTMQTADADAFVDEVVLIDMTEAFGENVPTDSQMLELYSRYLRARQGREIRYLLAESEPVYSFRACQSAFLAAMRKKAEELGLKDTVITSASGLMLDNCSTAWSMNVVNMAASGYEVMSRIWGRKTREIEIRGKHGRTKTVKSTVQNADFEKEYLILGGKTGTYQLADGLYSALMVTAVDKKGRVYCGCVMKASARWPAMLSLFRKMEQAADDPAFDPNSEPVKEAECVVGWALPSFRMGETGRYYPKAIYEQNADKVCMTASVVKTLSVITALDIVPDLNAWYTIAAEDIRGGSGKVFEEGDRVRILDLLYAMMLPSSNTAATALAHYVGGLLLQEH